MSQDSATQNQKKLQMGEMSTSPRDRWWTVTYASTLPGLAVIGAPGSLLLRHEAEHWVLLDAQKLVIDA
jgi:hypothetical protein